MTLKVLRPGVSGQQRDLQPPLPYTRCKKPTLLFPLVRIYDSHIFTHYRYAIVIILGLDSYVSISFLSILYSFMPYKLGYTYNSEV